MKPPKNIEQSAQEKLRELLPPPDASPALHFLAGPNGSGKSTLYETRLAHLEHPFINADMVQKDMLGLIPGTPKPDVLAQAMAETMRLHFIKNKASFFTETVFSDEKGAKLQFLRDTQELGYHVTMHYVCIESPQDSMARVNQRVKNGGHSVPHEKLTRRFHQSMSNAKEALKFVDLAIVYENMSDLVPDPQSLGGMPHEIMAIVQLGETQWTHPKIPSYILALLPKATPKNTKKSK